MLKNYISFSHSFNFTFYLIIIYIQLKIMLNKIIINDNDYCQEYKKMDWVMEHIRFVLF